MICPTCADTILKASHLKREWSGGEIYNDLAEGCEGHIEKTLVNLLESPGCGCTLLSRQLNILQLCPLRIQY